MNKDKLMKAINDYSSPFSEEIEYKKQILNFLLEHDIYLGKENQAGHITGSAWLIQPDGRKVLMTHHKKLDRWLQLGGHTETDETVSQSALREAKEESGLENISFLYKSIFDMDVHLIPAKGDTPEHYHYDIRFLLVANDPDEKVLISDESNDIKWIHLAQIKEYSTERSIVRMVEKHKMIFSQ